MKKVNFTAFDFETATYDRMPCQLGLVVVREGKIIEEKEYLIKPPENKYDPGCTKTHQITSKDTELCQEFNDIWNEIKPYFHHELMVAHNIDFDIDVLHKICNFYNLDKAIPLCFYDTMLIFNNRSLLDVTSALKIKMEKHHDALNDARACAEIYMEYLKGIDLKTLKYPERKIRNKSINKEVFNPDHKISSDAKKQDLSIVEDIDNPFYNKKIVISGTFENYPIRNDLALLLKKYGADINGSISKETNIFIAGSAWGPKKMEKVEQLKNDGYNIKIMNENDLINELINIYGKERICEDYA